jgi:DNA invertase Pin-like site-specific DNA recombinase
MGNGPAVGRPDLVADGVFGVSVAWSDAAATLRLAVERLALPAHVAGYLRGYADSLERGDTGGASEWMAGVEVVSALATWLAAYVRDPVVSSRASVEQQRLRIGAAVDRGRFQVSAWYQDGRPDSTNLRGGGLQAARAAISASTADGIVVAEMAGLGRTSLEAFDLIQRAGDEGWRLVALDCRFDSALLSGQLAATAFATTRRLEWRRLGARPHRRPQHPTNRASAGDIPAEVVEKIILLRARGESYHSIAAALNRDHAPGAAPGQWSTSAIRALLRTTST